MTNDKKSSVFKIYNILKKEVGKKDSHIELSRLNKGLSLALGETVEERNYDTKLKICQCKDYEFRGRQFWCKHIIGWWMLHPTEFGVAWYEGEIS
jgi:hypothetical protein